MEDARKREEILSEMKVEYGEKGLRKMGGWKEEGEIAWARAVPKAKDLNHMRPIVSCCKVGYCCAGKLAARCLSVLIEEVKGRITHMDMRETGEIVDTFRKINGSKEWKRNLSKGNITMMKFDIKDLSQR